MKKANIIFDLGNVLVHIHPERTLRSLARESSLPVEALSDFFLSPLHLELMAGHCTFPDFHREFCRRYQVDLSYSTFSECWRQVIGEPKAGVRELAAELKSQGYRLYICSNTDELHWQTACRQSPFLAGFDGYFLSFRIGINKPAPGIFRVMLEQLACTADECIFIDDTPTNIRSAAQLGFLTVLADRTSVIRKALQRLISDPLR